MQKFDKKAFIAEVKDNVKKLYRKNIEEADKQQIFQAVSYAVKDSIIDNWMMTQKEYEKQDPKYVYYMSMEFLMGRAMGNNLINLTEYDEVKEALDELGFDLNVIEDQEPDAALGNGGLGRLAACFLDSLATLNYAAYGCGIRYRYGMFKQKIEDGYQVEVPDNWLKNGNPFELRRPEYAKEVKFGGYVRVEYDEKNHRNNFIQENYQSVRAVPFDIPIVGYNNGVVNTLRVWDAEPIVDFQLEIHDGLCIPYAKRINYAVVVTNDGDIKGNGTNGLIVLLDEVVAVIFLIIFHTHITAEFYLFGILRTAKLEGVAVFQPVIRYLYLITVLNLLFEHSVTITDTTAVSRIIQGCQRIQEAGCQTAQSTVSKSSIRLLILDDVQVKTKLIQSFFYLIILGQVDQVVSHGTTHQELHGHVINVFRILFLIFFLGHHPVIDDAVFHRIRHGLEDLLFVSFLDIFAVKLLYIIFYFCNKSFFVEFLHDCLLFYLL